MNYVTANITAISNYADRQRHGESIATGFVESAVNQVVSKRLVKNSKCGGHYKERMGYCKSEPACSISSCALILSAGTHAFSPLASRFVCRRSTQKGPLSHRDADHCARVVCRLKSNF